MSIQSVQIPGKVTSSAPRHNKRIVVTPRRERRPLAAIGGVGCKVVRPTDRQRHGACRWVVVAPQRVVLACSRVMEHALDDRLNMSRCRALCRQRERSSTQSQQPKADQERA